MNIWKKSYVNYQLCFVVMQCKLKVKQIKVHLTGNALICIISFNENVIFVYLIYISFIDVFLKRPYYVSFLGNNVYYKIIYFYIFIIWILWINPDNTFFLSVFVIFYKFPVFNTSHIQYIDSLNPKLYVFMVFIKWFQFIAICTEFEIRHFYTKEILNSI